MVRFFHMKELKFVTRGIPQFFSKRKHFTFQHLESENSGPKAWKSEANFIANQDKVDACEAGRRNPCEAVVAEILTAVPGVTAPVTKGQPYEGVLLSAAVMLWSWWVATTINDLSAAPQMRPSSPTCHRWPVPFHGHEACGHVCRCGTVVIQLTLWNHWFFMFSLGSEVIKLYQFQWEPYHQTSLNPWIQFQFFVVKLSL